MIEKKKKNGEEKKLLAYELVIRKINLKNSFQICQLLC